MSVGVEGMAPLTDPARQRRGIWLTLAAIAAFITLVMAGFLHKITTPRVLTPLELRANGTFVFEQPRILTDFQLQDQHGQPFSLTQLQGRWSLVFFGYASCPDICPTTLALLQQVQAQLQESVRDQVQVVMVTVDPARDTVATLSQYMPYFDPEFIGVTGDFLTIKRLATQLSIAFVKVKTGEAPTDYTVDHSGNLVLINPKGHYHGFIKTPLDAGRIKLTLQSLVTTFES